MFQPLRSSGVYPFTQTKDFGFNISLPSTETSLDFESGDRCFSPPENSNDETYQPHTKAIAKSQNKKSDKHKNFELKLKTEVLFFFGLLSNELLSLALQNVYTRLFARMEISALSPTELVNLSKKLPS